jgi:hypothetical protein
VSDSDRSEAALRARAQILIPDTIVGTDLITVEVGGQSEDIILTQEDAKYLHYKIASILGLPCWEED